MANIRQSEAPQGIGLNPTETGIEAIAGTARRVGTFGNQIADLYGQEGSELKSTITDVGSVAENYMTHRDISAGAANGAQFIAQKNDQWNEIAKTADPNDVTIKQKFIEENLNPALEQFKSGFSTERSQQWAEHFVDQYRAHMSEKTSADMSTLAGIAVRKNVATTVNALSSAVASDPSSLDFALKSVDHSIGATVASSPNISATDAAAVTSEVGLKAKESIVKSAISGMIQKNPNIDLDAIQKKYGDYINGAEMKMFQKATQTQAKVDAYHDKSAQIAQRQLDDLNVHKSATDAITKNVSIDPNSGKPIINPKFFNDALDIAKQNPNAPTAAATVRTMLDWGESQMSKSDHSTDPAVASTIDSRMFVPDNPTTKMDVMRAEADKKMSSADASLRMKIIDQRDKLPTDPQFKFAMDGAKQLIDGRTPGERSMQAGKYATFMQEFLPEYQRQKAAGTLPPNALSLRDPNSLLSKSMEAYKSPLAAAISGNGGIGATPAPPRNDAMPVIPAAGERPVGSIYDTPRGKMKWTGTGWVQP